MWFFDSFLPGVVDRHDHLVANCYLACSTSLSCTGASTSESSGRSRHSHCSERPDADPPLGRSGLLAMRAALLALGLDACGRESTSCCAGDRRGCIHGAGVDRGLVLPSRRRRRRYLFRPTAESFIRLFRSGEGLARHRNSGPDHAPALCFVAGGVCCALVQGARRARDPLARRSLDDRIAYLSGYFWFARQTQPYGKSASRCWPLRFRRPSCCASSWLRARSASCSSGALAARVRAGFDLAALRANGDALLSDHLPELELVRTIASLRRSRAILEARPFQSRYTAERRLPAGAPLALGPPRRPRSRDGDPVGARRVPRGPRIADPRSCAKKRPHVTLTDAARSEE